MSTVAATRRRTELASFLRSRRARITPEAVGLPPGVRRRTPGLRREEVAQLAGVGVTWYTWLEQGRPINASVQVLDAIARTLGLDQAECQHLYELAEVRAGATAGVERECVPADVQHVLDVMVGVPASLLNSRFDLLAWNDAYAALFPYLVRQPKDRRNELRNVLWRICTTPQCCNPFVNRDTELPRLVATLRAAFGRHVNEPSWQEFVRGLSEASPEFARLWDTHDVAASARVHKVFRHQGVGQVEMTGTTLSVLCMPETRLTVYRPVDDTSRRRLDRLIAEPELRKIRCPTCASRFALA